MNTPLRFFITCFSFFLLSGLSAQRKHDLHFGCHMTDHPVILPTLTEEERMLACGSNERSDSIDILNYNLDVDLTKFGQSITATCIITFTAKEDGIQAIPLDLLDLTIDEVSINGIAQTYDYDDLLLNVHLENAVNIGDSVDVTIKYHGLPTPDPSWGGFRFENGIGYNLGIGLNSNPFPIGRSLYPCFDNFVERATYDISVVTAGGRTGYAIGEFLGEETIGGDTIRRSYRMPTQNPTYLTAIAASNYIEINDMHNGAFGEYPVLLVGRPQDASDMADAFQYLGDAIDALEFWFGPYAWDQVGYVMTPRGAMEHSSLIAFPYNSIGSGATFGMNRLMAHELAHHWWGNTTTLSCPENMWIKEGNAEYGSHLFQEYTFGREFFLDVVKSNHFNVIQNAHRDDGGIYHPLSGIPQEYTYGTHTYNKGASMMHNLRTYLGDDLFKQSMTSILEAYRFSAIDAQQMQEQLTSDSGIDMSHFFNNWIYQPGYANYEIESVSYQEVGGSWDADIAIQQKLHNANSFHTQTPMEITFFDSDFTAHHAQVMVSGEMSDVAVAGIPFEPVFQVMNDRHPLNLGRVQDRKIMYGTGDLNFDDVAFTDVEILEFPDNDSALFNVVHHYTAPDEELTLPELGLSTTHYWNFDGIIPGGTSVKGRLNCIGSNPLDLDYEILQNGTDDIILVWRPDSDTPWGEYPYYSAVSPTGTWVRFNIEEILPGDYAFAAGEAPLATAVADLKSDLSIKSYPNPSTDVLNVQGIWPSNTDVQLAIFDALGQQIRRTNIAANGNQFATQLEVSDLPAGLYNLEVSSEDGVVRSIDQFVKD